MMKGFYRIVCGVAAVLVSLGLLLSLVGFLMGGRISNLDQVVFPLHGAWRIGPFRSWDLTGNPLSGSDKIDTVYPATDIRKLDFDLSCANITLKEGDAFRIEAKRINAKRIRTEVVGDTWEIECDVTSARNLTAKNTPTITLTVPRGFVAEDLDLELSMGTLELKNIAARESDIKNEMGSITASGFSSGNCDFDVGMGSLQLTGEITGHSNIECGMGGVELFLSGSPEDYGFDVSVDMGSVEVNGQEISPGGLPSIGSGSVGGFASERSWNTSAPNQFTIDCGMGSVEINFR